MRFVSLCIVYLKRFNINKKTQDFTDRADDWYINIAFARGGAHLGILRVDTILDRENHVLRRRVSWWTGNLILSHFDIKIILLV